MSRAWKLALKPPWCRPPGRKQQNYSCLVDPITINIDIHISVSIWISQLFSIDTSITTTALIFTIVKQNFSERIKYIGSCSVQCSTPEQYLEANDMKYGVEKNNWNLTQQIYFWQMNYSLWEALSSTGVSATVTVSGMVKFASKFVETFKSIVKPRLLELEFDSSMGIKWYLYL